jgi:hypothetical protein
VAHHVTIEGSFTPTDWLPRGVRRTVEVTEDIRKLVAIGGAIVVAGSLDEPDTVAYGDSDDAVGEVAEVREVPGYPVPAGNASREDWAEFIASQGLGVTEGKSRDELREIWQQANGDG